jgi:hypothetical protein
LPYNVRCYIQSYEDIFAPQMTQKFVVLISVRSMSPCVPQNFTALLFMLKVLCFDAEVWREGLQVGLCLWCAGRFQKVFILMLINLLRHKSLIVIIVLEKTLTAIGRSNEMFSRHESNRQNPRYVSIAFLLRRKHIYGR